MTAPLRMSAPRVHRVFAYLCLGSNLGQARAQLAAALEAVQALEGVHVDGLSRVYMTEPQGDPDQPWFANQLARLECQPAMTAHALLDALLDIEQQMGRQRDLARRFGPRSIDLDIVSYTGVLCESPRLTLPHPRLAERAFVLVPLHELEPDLILPDGRAIRSLLAQLVYRVEDTRIYQ